jgi:hypothetical protein
MIYNELFESIIRTSGQDTDDVFAEYDNFWAPVPIIERIFEQVLKETHLQEMSNSKINSSIKKIHSYIGNRIKGWFPEIALGALKKATGEDKNKCIPMDNNGNIIDKTDWVIGIIKGLLNFIEIMEPLRKLRDLFPKFFSGLQEDRLIKELLLEDQEDSLQHSQNS